MTQNLVVEQLLSRREEIAGMGARRLALFGPAARGEDISNGEVHLLVEFTDPPAFEHFLALRNYLSAVLGRPVELVVERLDHPQIWPYVQDDLVQIL